MRIGYITSNRRVGSRYKYVEMFSRVADVDTSIETKNHPGDYDAILVTGDKHTHHRIAMAAGIPYILIENDVASLRRGGGPDDAEREMVENAAALLLTSEGHHEYLARHYRLPDVTEIVHLRPLLKDLCFDPLPKRPRTVVYAGGIVHRVSSRIGYRTYNVDLFPAIARAGWEIHVYPSWRDPARIRAYEDIGCIIHDHVPQAALYRELSQYAVGFQGYSVRGPQSYVSQCMPNKTWEYGIGAGIPTLGFNTGRSGAYYDGRWGLVAPSLEAFGETLDKLKGWEITEELRRSEVMDQDLPAFERLVAACG